MASRLHQNLQVGENNAFTVEIGDITLTSDDLSEIVITRGSGGYSYGLQPATSEFSAVGLRYAYMDTPVSVKLTPAAAGALARATGASAAAITDRFAGRHAIQEVTDGVDGSPKLMHYAASSYSVMLKNARKTFTVTSGKAIYSVLIQAFLNREIPGVKLHNVPDTSEKYWDKTYLEAPEEMTFADVISKYAETLHILIQECRNGYIKLLSPKWRYEQLGQLAARDYAVLRDEVISPAKWVQDSDQQSAQLVQVYRDGDIVRRRSMAIAKPEGAYEYPLERQEVDHSHIIPVEDLQLMVMRAKNLQMNYPRLILSQVQIDLLYLLESKSTYDKRLAAQLLNLEHGDPIFIGGDWSNLVRGVLIAQKIKETITPDSWIFEIEFTHAGSVFGVSNIDLPTVPARTWAQATTTWDSTPGRWN